MDIQQILKVLKNERECIKRQSEYSTARSFVPKCNRDCANCDLCLPDNEILEVYDFLINGYELLQNKGAESYTIRIKKEGDTVEVNEYGREHFKGICPYTNKKCDTWTCGICEVEERERKFAEGDTE